MPMDALRYRLTHSAYDRHRRGKARSMKNAEHSASVDTTASSTATTLPTAHAFGAICPVPAYGHHEFHAWFCGLWRPVELGIRAATLLHFYEIPLSAYTGPSKKLVISAFVQIRFSWDLSGRFVPEVREAGTLATALGSLGLFRRSRWTHCATA